MSRLLAASAPPRYVRAPAGSILDPFKDWICEQLDEDATTTSQRLRELAEEIGYRGGKTVFDDYVREMRPRFFAKRTFQRTIYRPAELIQCDLWEPSKHVPVGWGQCRRGWVVTSQSCWSRAFAGTLVFSKEAPDILAGLARNLQRLGVRAEKLVWDRESAIAGRGKPTRRVFELLRAAAGRLDHPRRRRSGGEGAAGAPARLSGEELRAAPQFRQPPRLSRTSSTAGR